MPRIQYRADTFRCGWGAKSAADRIFAGPSSCTMEAPVDCERETNPAMASCGTDPTIAMMGREKEGGCRNPESPRHRSSRRWEIMRNPIFTQIKTVVCTGFAFHPDFPPSFPRKARQWRACYANQGREFGREW